MAMPAATPALIERVDPNWGIERHSVTAAAGDTLIVVQTADSLVVRHIGVSGSEQVPVTLAPSPVRREQQAGLDAILFGTEFARPGVATAHPALRQSRTP